MKAFVVSVLSIGVAGLLVALGWSLGYRDRLRMEVETSHAIEHSVLRAQIVAKHLDELHVGDVTAMRDELALQLYGNVMQIEMYFEQAHPAWRKSAQDILALIADRRAHWASNYTSPLARESDRVIKVKLDAIASTKTRSSK